MKIALAPKNLLPVPPRRSQTWLSRFLFLQQDLHDESVLSANGILFFFDTIFYLTASFTQPEPSIGPIDSFIGWTINNEDAASLHRDLFWKLRTTRGA